MRFVGALALLAATCCAAPARADDEDARALFARALDEADAGELTRALDDFQRAYDLGGSWKILFNVAKVQAALGRPVDAIASYRRYLAEGGTAVDPVRREVVLGGIARQRTLVGTIVLTLSPVDAVVGVDGGAPRALEAGAPLALAAGEHDLDVSKRGYVTSRVHVVVHAEEVRVLSVSLAAEPPPPIHPPTPPTPTGPSDTSRTPRMLGWVGVAGGAALLAGAGAVALWNDGRWRAWERDRATLDDAWRTAPAASPDLTTRQSQSDDQLSSIHRWDRIDAGVAIAGGAFVATGVVLLVTSRRPVSTHTGWNAEGGRMGWSIDW